MSWDKYDLAPSETGDLYDPPPADPTRGYDPADGHDRIDWRPCPPGCDCPWVRHGEAS